MLSELTISNLAIIDAVSLTFAPGFNVLTGETGAGKSIIIDAVSLLLGGRSDASMVRAGADVAQLEGLFTLDGELRAAVDPILEREELQADDDGGALALAREVRREGRNVCRVNGRTVSLAILKEIGQQLVDIHGQSEHLSLLRVREHLNLLDRYAGLETQRAELAAVARELNAVRRELAELVRSEKDAARRIDLLNFQINEITAAKTRRGQDSARGAHPPGQRRKAGLVGRGSNSRRRGRGRRGAALCHRSAGANCARPQQPGQNRPGAGRPSRHGAIAGRAIGRAGPRPANVSRVHRVQSQTAGSSGRTAGDDQIPPAQIRRHYRGSDGLWAAGAGRPQQRHPRR
ncbi:MAG: AAA family ATPase [Chloroflexi bacterium]|nr:AAA family ATPase [Chloroflexota bacterium]